MKLLAWRPDVNPICIPRTAQQEQALQFYSDKGNVLIPAQAEDGLNLLYHSDLVIGGGGTMNREAAVLGVPVISIFKGPEGAVDKWLVNQSKMVTIEQAKEILPFLKKRLRTSTITSSQTKTVIVDAIARLAAS
jgi:predicted glycosyltransferase